MTPHFLPMIPWLAQFIECHTLISFCQLFQLAGVIQLMPLLPIIPLAGAISY
jgi:hypothetical protein